MLKNEKLPRILKVADKLSSNLWLSLTGSCNVQTVMLFSVVKREFNSPRIKILCIVCFEAVARGLYDVSNDRLKCADI